MTASTLAATVRSTGTPASVVEHRLALAADVAGDIAGSEAVTAALVVGSTALRRCSERADLDLVVVTDTDHGDRFDRRTVDGVRVEIEWVGRRRALALTEGTGWTWELRAAARLGCGAPVLDPYGFAASLGPRAAAMRPAPDRFEATLREIYLALVALAGGDGSADALRGCLDNVALLALLERPRRYQKPKWALADLLHAGEDALAESVLGAYGIDSDDVAPVAGARELIASVYARAGLPSHEAILAMGHTPEYAEASYVSRCLDDAEDLAASGRSIEAQYAAKFAVRLAAALVGDAGSIPDAFESLGLTEPYLDLFDGGQQPDPDLVDGALAAADALRQAA